MDVTITLTLAQADLLLRLAQHEYHMAAPQDVELIEDCQAIITTLDKAIGDELATVDAGE